jgi:hypothetical protein
MTKRLADGLSNLPAKGDYVLHDEGREAAHLAGHHDGGERAVKALEDLRYSM